MNLMPVDGAKEVRNAYRHLRLRLNEGAKRYRRDIGYQGGDVSKVVHWHARFGFWSVIDTREFFWCPFGTQNPGVKASGRPALKITCEINSSHEGRTERYGGRFWSDGQDLYLGHTGKVGGGRKGIGKSAFLAWYAEHHGLDTANGIVIGKIASRGFLQRLASFIRAVEEFKDEVVNPQDIDHKLELDARMALQEGEFDATNVADSRERTLRSINVRRGQPEFRKTLLAAYGRRCAMSGCDCVEALEAAHIRRYGGQETNHVQNGILLRGDLHTLFDLGKIGIDPSTFRIVVSQELISTSYSRLGGSKLRLPVNRSHWPNQDLLKMHLRSWKLE